MPRKFRLTWQSGCPARGGRWRKKYKGKTYYFPGGRGKSDREAYEAALTLWDALKARLDAAAPRRHQVDYERTITEWEQVLAWSNRHGEQTVASVAFERLASLRHRLEAPLLRPLSSSDRFESLFKLPTLTIPDEVFRQVAAELAENQVQLHQVPGAGYSRQQEFAAELDGSAARIAREIWKDRLETQQRRAAACDQSLDAQINAYVQERMLQVDVGGVTTGRVYAIRLHLMAFQEWLGRETAVQDIDGASLMAYRGHLLEKVQTKTWTRITVRHYLTSVKAFVRWLWRMETIPSLPRILEGKSDFLNFGTANSPVVVFTVEEIRTLLRSAPDRLRLYMLLMLNCGMTQKDISDLHPAEIDWEQGRITRKRSKTSEHKDVPTVSYRLWSDTLRLLQQERSPEAADRVLQNANGSPLWTETLTPDGKYRKTDNVKNSFDRLRTKLAITKSLKSLKKTSASLLRANPHFQGLEGLFLGHAPKSMADRHYTRVPEELLDEAIRWLESKYEISPVTRHDKRGTRRQTGKR